LESYLTRSPKRLERARKKERKKKNLRERSIYLKFKKTRTSTFSDILV
jgi:hypothetical protein